MAISKTGDKTSIEKAGGIAPVFVTCGGFGSVVLADCDAGRGVASALRHYKDQAAYELVRQFMDTIAYSGITGQSIRRKLDSRSGVKRTVVGAQRRVSCANSQFRLPLVVDTNHRNVNSSDILQAKHYSG